MFRVKTIAGLAILVASISGSAFAQAAGDWPQWRGPNRDGISKETGLLKEWPKEGPKLVWKAQGAGQGYSTLAISGGRIYTLGLRGDREFVIALSRFRAVAFTSRWTGSATRLTP